MLKLIQKLDTRILEPLLLSFMICFTLPYTVYYYNDGEFSNLAFSLLFQSFLYFFIISAFLTALTFVGEKTHKVIKAFCILFASYILICNFFLPIQTGLIDKLGFQNKGELFLGISLEWVKFISIWLGLGLFYYLNKKVLREVVLCGAAISLLWVGYIIGDDIFSGQFKETKKDQLISQFSNLSRDRNILIISFDALQGSTIEELLSESPELREKFEGFTFYPNTASVAPFTELSLFTSYLGRVPQEAKSTQELQDNHLPDMFPHDFRKEGYDVAFYNYPGKGKKPAGFTYARPLDFSQSDMMFLKLDNLESASTLKIMPFRLQQLLINANSYLRKLFKSELTLADIMKDYNPAFTMFSMTFLDFQSYTNELRANNPNRTLQYHHYTFSHGPLTYTRSCRFSSYKDIEQNYDSSKEEAYCTLKVAADFIGKLKELGIYDNTLLIFTSDHGMAARYQNIRTEQGRKAEEDFGTRWSASRYHAFLMIKDMNEKPHPLVTSDRPVSLLDIAPTVCSKEFTKGFCDSKFFEGVNLLTSLPTKRERPILLLKGSEDERDYSAFSKEKVREDIVSSIHDHYTTVRASTPKQTMKHLEIDFTKKKTYPEISKTSGLSGTETPNGQWSDGSTITFQFKDQVPNNFKLKLNAGAYRPNIGKPFLLKVGKQEKTFTLGSENSEQEFLFSNVGPEVHQIQFVVPFPTSPADLNLSSDPRKLGIRFIRLTLDQI